MHRLFTDLETGGTNPKVNPIMTIYFRLLDENFKFMAELDLKVKPDNLDDWVYEPQALEVNKIDLDKHLADPNTITYSEAKNIITEFFKTYKIDGKKQSYRIHGHNVVFDINFMLYQLFDESEWKKFVHHTIRDTFVLVEWLRELKLYPEDAYSNLAALVEYYDVPKEEAHEARGDIGMTIGVYKKMCAAMSVIKTNALSGISDAILNIIETR